ncbi:MAG TPA: SRPBCC family protein [Conexibacter sp.]
MEVRAIRTIDAPPDRVFAFLEEPDRHWQLMGRRLEPLRTYDGQRSQARLRGPLGIHRTLWIEMAGVRPPLELIGRVEAGRGQTVGTVRWIIHPLPGAAPESGRSNVELIAGTVVSGWLDRLLLVFGGARWLRESLKLVLEQLERELGGAAPPDRGVAPPEPEPRD